LWKKSAALGISRSGGARNPHVFQYTLRLLVPSLGLAPSGLALRFAPGETVLRSGGKPGPGSGPVWRAEDAARPPFARDDFSQALRPVWHPRHLKTVHGELADYAAAGCEQPAAMVEPTKTVDVRGLPRRWQGRLGIVSGWDSIEKWTATTMDSRGRYVRNSANALAVCDCLRRRATSSGVSCA
jgi:hypothetical protein